MRGSARVGLAGTVASAALALIGGCGDDGENGRQEGAAHTPEFQFTYLDTMNVLANDLHVTISGTGGSLRNPVITQEAPNCGNTPGQATASGNMIHVTWGSPCVQGFPGDKVKIKVDSDFPNLTVVSEVWTLGGQPMPLYR